MNDEELLVLLARANAAAPAYGAAPFTWEELNALRGVQWDPEEEGAEEGAEEG